MFPLGRFYEEGGGFRYFLQVHECPKEPKAKVKVKKWIDTPNVKEYEAFVNRWHDFLKKLERALQEKNDPAWAKRANLRLLEEFYLKPYTLGEFYREFGERCKIT